MKINDYDIIPVYKLSLEKKIMILEWRNHESIRKWMYDSEIISEVLHLKFIENLKNNTKNKYFLVQKNNTEIGVIYFNKIDVINKSTYFGLYSNVNCKIAGIGRILEKKSIDFIFDTLKLNTLKLEVFSDNIKVINLHKKFKFREVGKRIVNKKEVICMELKYENR
jgi:UDP-4-amino-4,6-dideoxy-N-acetyl-beta-L-altrosamine N-acetyltransferase